MGNKECDILIIGASLDGINMYNWLLKNKKKRTLLVSNFVHSKLATMESYIQAKVVYISYYHRMIIVSLEDGRTISCQYLILAVGDKLKYIDVPGAEINYQVYDMNVLKTDNLLIIGSNNEAVDKAIKFANKCTNIYLCDNNFEMSCDTKHSKLLTKYKNISWLPNCMPTSVESTSSTKVIHLSTYDTLTCNTIIGCIGREAETRIANVINLEYDDDGFIKTNELCQIKSIKEIFAIGACRGKNATSKDYLIVANQIN